VVLTQQDLFWPRRVELVRLLVRLNCMCARQRAIIGHAMVYC
jgi:hypothetical protein